MNTLKIILLLTILSLSSCKVEPRAIAYGQDHCHFCDMTVVDKTHASQYVTQKGRVYVFDAIECMSRDLSRNHSNEEMAFVLVADYSNPGTLINAFEASFLISEGIQSPMGENLSAFKEIEIAKQHQEEFTGKIYTWNGLTEILK